MATGRHLEKWKNRDISATPLSHWNFPYALHCTAATCGAATHRAAPPDPV